MLPVLAMLATVGTVMAWQRADDAVEARHYAEAEVALAEGRSGEALRSFALAGDHRDAPRRHAAIDREVRAAVGAAEVAMAAGRYAEAIVLLRPVAAAFPGHRQAGLLLAQGIALRQAELEAAIRAGERGGDWLAVERALAERLDLSPVDAAAGIELAALRATRSPLVFARHNVLYLAAPDGSDERVVTDAVPVAWPAWSPDRRWIAFLSPATGDSQYAAALYLVAPDGTSLRWLAADVLRSRWPIWSPDGTRILYTSVAGFEESGTGGDPGTISTRMVEVATGVETDLTTGTADYAGAGTWSPDGRRVAVVVRPFVPTVTETFDLGQSEIRIIDLATRGVREVAAGRLPASWKLSWAPSGDALFVLTLTEDASSMRFDTTALYRLDLGSEAIEEIEDGATDVTLPVWSPDGRRAAYVVDFRTVRFWSADEPSREVRLEGPFYEAVSWSPDGSRILLPVAESARSSLVLMTDGTDAVTPAHLVFSTDWSNGGPPLWTSRTFAPGQVQGTIEAIAIPADATPLTSPPPG
ncbi:MAG: hypothetical protein M3462_07365 [Chloroflexota bacterium]|nr:hypothetical protein [Chloroflexota bacterium]